MIVIPAIDIRQGNSVRLKQGKVENETVHSTDPVFIAKLWQSKGAKRIHVVDLDGAIINTSKNSDIIRQICEAVDIDVEVGGGIRDMQKVDKVFEMGASFVVMGTIAVTNPEVVKSAIEKYGANKIIIAVDAKDGKVATDGWKEVSNFSVDSFVERLKEYGVKEIMYTDISRDGMLSGPDFSGLEKLSKTGLRVIASGGIKTVKDLVELKKYEKDGLIGAIVGSALYTDDFNLEDAIERVK